MKYQLIVMGASLGGIEASRTILSYLPKTFCIPIALVLHRNPVSLTDLITEALNKKSNIQVVEAEDKMPVKPKCCYIAPAGYHLLIDDDHFALSTAEKVNYSRPSIDVLFETASDTFHSRLIAILLTGNNADGSCGLAAVNKKGGLTIVQDVNEARAAIMPESAIQATVPDHVLPLKEIGPLLINLANIS